MEMTNPENIPGCGLQLKLSSIIYTYIEFRANFTCKHAKLVEFIFKMQNI